MQVNRIGVNVVRQAVEQRLPEARGEDDMDQFDFPEVEKVIPFKADQKLLNALLDSYPFLKDLFERVPVVSKYVEEYVKKNVPHEIRISKLNQLYMELVNNHVNVATFTPIAIGLLTNHCPNLIELKKDFYCTPYAQKRIEGIMAGFGVSWPRYERG